MNTMLWTAYWIGVVVFPIVVGMLCGVDKDWDALGDGFLLFFLSIIWPIIFVILVGFAIATIVCIVFGAAWWCLLMLGGMLAEKIETKKQPECFKNDENKLEQAKPETSDVV